ncbi:MAG: Mu-like prophage major head subunit gpT family protein [Armatimonadota bacterium]
MSVVSSDMAQQWSTRFETLHLVEYNSAIAVARQQLDPLLLPITLEDHQGDEITLDWLGAAPQMRRWVDEKRAQGLNKNSWKVKVENFEASIEVDLNAFNDARMNPYELRIREMSRNAARLPYNLISDLIKAGLAAKCYDGQYFYDTDHEEGDSGAQSNKLVGTGTSQAAIETDFYAAKAALMGFKDDKGEPLAPFDFRPVVWLPNNATLIQRFATLAGAQMVSQTSNILAGKFDIVVDPRLTDPNDWGMFRTDTLLKPFILVNREEPHYEDNFASKAGDVFDRRKGKASVVGRLAAAYGMWQNGVWTTN